jgi:hypothetical protein
MYLAESCKQVTVDALQIVQVVMVLAHAEEYLELKSVRTKAVVYKETSLTNPTNWFANFHTTDPYP